MWQQISRNFALIHGITKIKIKWKVVVAEVTAKVKNIPYLKLTYEFFGVLDLAGLAAKNTRSFKKNSKSGQYVFGQQLTVALYTFFQNCAIRRYHHHNWKFYVILTSLIIHCFIFTVYLNQIPKLLSMLK